MENETHDKMWFARCFDAEGVEREEWTVIGYTFNEVVYGIENHTEPVDAYDVYAPDGALAFRGEWYIPLKTVAALDAEREAEDLDPEDEETIGDVGAFIESDMAQTVISLGAFAVKDLGPDEPMFALLALMGQPDEMNAPMFVRSVMSETAVIPHGEAAVACLSAALLGIAEKDAHERQRVLRHLSDLLTTVRNVTFEAEA